MEINKWDLYFKDAALIPAVLFSLSILPFVFPSLLFVFVLPPSIRRVSIRATAARTTVQSLVGRGQLSPAPSCPQSL